jgi:hypothetical protein
MFLECLQPVCMSVWTICVLLALQLYVDSRVCSVSYELSPHSSVALKLVQKKQNVCRLGSNSSDSE